jgi:hypothetical protein
LSENQFAGALAFGYDVCDKYETGMTYEEALDVYGPDSDAFPVEDGSADAWIDRTAEGVTQILIVAATLAAVGKHLCPETRARSSAAAPAAGR